MREFIRNWLSRNKLAARLLATLVFGGFVYLGVNGVSDAWSIFVNPTPSMMLLPISADAAKLRAALLLALNVGVMAGSLATMLGIWQKTTLAYGYRWVAGLYAALGLYQAVSALFQFKRPEYAVTGLVYLALSAAAFSLGRQAVVNMTRRR